ncbi:MAG: YihY/virulence factor BrkB family protein [Pirellulaceae bacterium]
MRTSVTAIKAAIQQFSEDDCTSQAASLAYYTLFAMPPLLFLLVSVVSSGMSVAYESETAREHVEEFLQLQAANLIGDQAAAAEIRGIIDNTQQRPGTWWKSALSLLGVVAGATGLVASLQASLNRVWKVRPIEGAFAVRFLFKRAVSLAMILGFGFLLLVSLVVNAALQLFGDYLVQQFGMHGLATFAINHCVSFLMAWVLFAAILRYMPDARVPWPHVVIGAFVTVVTFTLGRISLFYYLSTANPTEPLGSAAGSLIVILLWVYYSSICLLFGAELTANLNVGRTEPEVGAAAVVELDVPSLTQEVHDKSQGSVRMTGTQHTSIQPGRF